VELLLHVWSLGRDILRGDIELTAVPALAAENGFVGVEWLDRLLISYRDEDFARLAEAQAAAGLREAAFSLCLELDAPPGLVAEQVDRAKTLLAAVSGLGVKAVENGFSVAFYRLEDLMHAMKADADVPTRRLRQKKYLKVALLVIDEVGFQTLSRQESSLLFRLVSYRYQKGATLITTNKSIKDWPEVLAGDEVMATALLDRLLHKCHLISIRGRSYRLRELDRVAR